MRSLASLLSTVKDFSASVSSSSLSDRNEWTTDLPGVQSHPAPLAIIISIVDVDPAQLIFTLEYRFHVRPWSRQKPQDEPRPGFEQVHPVIRVRHLVDENRSEAVTGEEPVRIKGTLSLDFAAVVCKFFMRGKPKADIARVVEDVRLISWDFDALDFVRGLFEEADYDVLWSQFLKKAKEAKEVKRLGQKAA